MCPASPSKWRLSWDGRCEARSERRRTASAVGDGGGTSLKLKANGTRKSESVWNDSGRPSYREFKQFSATGGGCSTLFTAPAWQLSAPGWANAACGTKRLDNDISAVADPYTGFDIYDSYLYEPEFTPGWLTIGGTSLSAPLISALYGLAGGSHGVGYPATTLYTHLGEASALYDVTTGGNGYCDGDAAGSVTATSAVLNATVNPNGEAVSACTFEYGPTTSYGQSAPCSSLPGSGTSPIAVSATITGLTAKSTYHFRIAATNPSGASDGKSKTLKTP
jgi:hypothetical protein